MPAFALPEDQLQPLARWVRSLNVSAYDLDLPGDAAAGEQFFFGEGPVRVLPHGEGRGRDERAGSLRHRPRADAARQLEQALDDPDGAGGQPVGSVVPVVGLVPRRRDGRWRTCACAMGSGFAAFCASQGKHDLQLQTLDGRLHLLLDTEYREITREKAASCRPLKATPEERRDLLAYLSRLDGVAGGSARRQNSAPIPAEAIERILQSQAGEWPTYNGCLSAQPAQRA